LKEIPRIELRERGELLQVKGIVNCSKELEKGRVGERIKDSGEIELKRLNCPIDIRLEYANSLCSGGELLLWGIFSEGGRLGGDGLAEKGKSSEEVGREAAKELKEEIDSEGVVDKYLGDQLLIFMGLLPGSQMKVSEVTNHTKTNMGIIENFLPIKFKVENNLISVLEK